MRHFEIGDRSEVELIWVVERQGWYSRRAHWMFGWIELKALLAGMQREIYPEKAVGRGRRFVGLDTNTTKSGWVAILVGLLAWEKLFHYGVRSNSCA